MNGGGDYAFALTHVERYMDRVGMSDKQYVIKRKIIYCFIDLITAIICVILCEKLILLK